jgi:hypothetical protein
LTSLERYLSQVVAKRVYDAIAETWAPLERPHRPAGSTGYFERASQLESQVPLV